VTRYVALGSSYAAGPGVAPPAPDRPRGSGRSAANYPSLVAADLGLSLVDVTFSGATAAQLLTEGQGGQPPQIEAVTADTGLVTVTCGGNDVGYIGGLTVASLLGPFGRRVLRGKGAGPGQDDRFDALAVAYDAVLRAVRSRAPDARVLVVDYPAVVPPDGPMSDVRLRADVADWARRTAARLADVTRTAADRTECGYVAVSEASAGHHAWSSRPWTTTLRSRAPYHPNAAGMRGVADLVVGAVR
jgi:lysophospholipase L1-like esterase